MKFFTTPAAVRFFFPKCTWNISTPEKIIYLTFDDGPIPHHTDFILKTLEKFDAKATFFCVGDNIRKHTEIAREIIEQGHMIGNHTFHHLKAWSTKKFKYLDDIALFEKEFFQKLGDNTYFRLFRPPHGQLTPFLYNHLIRNGFEIVMWDILSYDFDQTIDRKEVMRILKNKSKKGSIVVFHDNYKAQVNLQEMLPDFLKHFKDEGYSFDSLHKGLFNRLVK